MRLNFKNINLHRYVNIEILGISIYNELRVMNYMRTTDSRLKIWL